MGWNAGFRIFESTVVGTYNLGKLDKEMLAVLMEPYRGSDIDSGGRRDIKSNDNKGVEQIVIETWGLEMPKVPNVEYNDDPDSWDNYHDAVYDQMRIVTKNFGW